MFQKPPYVSKIKMFPKNLFCFQKKICLEKVIIFTKSLTFSETYFCLEKGLMYEKGYPTQSRQAFLRLEVLYCHLICDLYII